jgi:hypothetical protein
MLDTLLGVLFLFGSIILLGIGLIALYLFALSIADSL